MRFRRTLSAVTAVLMAAACMLPFSAAAAGSETDVNASAEETAGKYEKLEFENYYDTCVTKEIDGYFYKLLLISDSSHVSNRMPSLTPKGDGAFSAEIAYDETVFASAGKIFKDIPLDENKYCISYEYANDENNDTLSAYAKAILSNPNIEIEFFELPESEASKRIPDYAGTIEMDGETYHVGKRASDGSSFKFYHVCSNEKTEQNTHRVTVPVYALLTAAKEFGLKDGKLHELSVEACGYDRNCSFELLKNEITEAETSILDKEEPYKIGANFSSQSCYNVIIDNFDFYCDEYFTSFGSTMTAFSKGRFSGEYMAPTYQLDKVYPEFSSTYNFENLTIPSLGQKQDVRVDYSINDKLKGKYSVFFEAMLENESSIPLVYQYFDVAEKLSDMEVEEFFKTFESQFGNNHLDLKSCTFLKTYSSGGHEYDLYSGYYNYYGCVGNHDEIRYLAVRKDSADDEKLDNTIDLYEHMKQLEEFSNTDTKAYNMSLIFRIIETEGTFDVTKQDILILDKELSAPEVIRGDFNGDDRIDSMDVSRARTELLKSMSDDSANIPTYADINLNGKFDVADIVMLQSFVLGKIRSFPEAE